MPTLMLKLLALTGVISAGCFAVWKANTELQPADSKSPAQFSLLEGEAEPNIGLGGQVVSNTEASENSPVEQEPLVKSDVVDEPGQDDANEPLSDQTLALAGHPFPAEIQPEEKSSPRGMPSDFPAEDNTEPAIESESEPVEPMAGVTSLEHLEASEKSKVAASVPTSGAAATKVPAVNSKELRGTTAPGLIAIPKSNETAKAKPKATAQVVPVNAEESTEAEPQLLVQAGSEPDAPGVLPVPEVAGEIVPASEETPANLPGLNFPAPRTRAMPTAPAAEEAPTLADEPNLFEHEAGGPDDTAQPEPNVETSEPAGASPIRVRNKSRSSIPLPSDSEPVIEPETEPQPLEPNPEQRALPARNDSLPDADSAAEPHPKSSLPRKPADELLYGEETSEVPQLAPSQQPQLKIEKKAQAEAEVDVEFIYDIIVQNIGQTPADKVVVEERIPNNCKMKRSSPTATLAADGVLRWELDTIEPNTTKVIKVEVLPLKAGPVGSVATVRFASKVSTKTMVTAPTLSLNVSYPKEVAVDEQVPVKFTLKNTGTGTARRVMLRTILQEGLQHPAGLDISMDDMTLKPNESKELTLLVTPKRDGQYSPTVVVTAGGIDQQEQAINLNVIPAYLTLKQKAQVQRFVNRPAVSETNVKNNSNKTLKNVRVTERIPEGLEPVVSELGRNASWEPKSRVMTWTFPSLGPQAEEGISLTVVSTKAGIYDCKMSAVDAADHRVELDSKLDVKGFEALTLDIDGNGTAMAAVGEQVSMQVTVRNKGSATAKGVQAVFEVPPQLKFVTANGPGQFKQEGNHVMFPEIESLDPDSSQTYKIVLVAGEEGRSKVAVELMSQDRPDPVRQEAPVTIIP
jgi:uncharacterized repeat protein (TIGR01451 family)